MGTNTVYVNSMVEITDAHCFVATGIRLRNVLKYLFENLTIIYRKSRIWRVEKGRRDRDRVVSYPTNTCTYTYTKY